MKLKKKKDQCVDVSILLRKGNKNNHRKQKEGLVWETGKVGQAQVQGRQKRSPDGHENE